MSKFNKILGISVSLLFFFLGLYILLSSRFAYLTMEIRVIFAVFLFIYGAWRLVRYIMKDPDKDSD
jgi:hypothetical protein